MNKKRIVISISIKEYLEIENKANACNMSINKYMKQKALDDTDAVKLRREAVCLMADLYRWAELTENLTARNYLREGGDRLCRCLK